MATKTVTVAHDMCCYGRVLLLPAWVCMSIRLPVFSSYLLLSFDPVLPVNKCEIRDNAAYKKLKMAVSLVMRMF